MGQVSKTNKQRKDTWNMNAPVHILASPTTTTLTTATPQPTTSHTEQRQGNEEEKVSLLTIREALLQNIEKGNEDVENGDELVMLTKRRLKNLLSSRYSCPDPAFDYSLEPDVYENTITMHCTTYNFKNTSQPKKSESWTSEEKHLQD
ncbi:hypothetical protein E2C01_062192 [Portunus trituberculatus]|uniref:Uncharacterized protein n=1 Tax=Portunus trituberculatus TaxID=210409 RepID=A0A5B7HCY8_PORTR|nr:hypothetical protein [Portunus trituberculatus]